MTMKRKILWGICVLWICGGVQCLAANYDDLWKQVERYENQGLPKSAYRVVEQIASKAVKEREKGQQMAALIYGCKLRQDVVPDSLYTDMLRLERLKEQASDEVQRMVLASVLGEQYAKYAGRNRNYSDRTDAHPDSIREWSWAQFMKASAENFAQSMARPDLLAGARASDYVPFVEKGRDAVYFQGDLLNVIGRRAAAMTQCGEDAAAKVDSLVYGRMLSVYRKAGNREAELLVMLDSISPMERMPYEDVLETDSAEVARVERKVLEGETYKAYARMLEHFDGLPLCAEVYLRMLDLQVSPRLKVQWLEEGYAKCKAYPRAKELLNQKKRLENPEFSFYLGYRVNPDMDFEAVVKHRNVGGVELRWYLMPEGEPQQGKLREEYNRDKWKYVQAHGRLQKTERLALQPGAAYEVLQDTFKLSVPGVGYYMLVGLVDGQKKPTADQIFGIQSSRLLVLGGFLPDTTHLCTVVYGSTGAPVPSATVEWYCCDTLVHTAQTDAAGKVRWRDTGDRWAKARSGMRVKVYKGDDRYAAPLRAYFTVPFHMAQADYSQIRLYTDRSIYRPGQTVHVGGLCSDVRHNDEQAVPGRKVDVQLRDPNGRVVASQTVESDEFGTFSTSFTLPSTGLSGYYIVRADKETASFKVEEYKRPTFEVRLDEPDGYGHEGDTVRLTGVAMNYNGVPLRHARVSATSSVARVLYRTARENHALPFDTVYTGEDGRFTLPVPVQKVGSEPIWWGVRQWVEVAVLSPSGETQTASTSFPLTKAGLQLSLEGAYQCVKDSLPTFKAEVRTAAGIPYKDTVEVFADLYLMDGAQRKKKVLSGLRLPANRAVRVAELASLPSADYEWEVRAVAEGDTAEYDYRIKLFGLSDRRPGNRDNLWFYCVGDTVRPGEPARLKVGTAADSATLYYMLFCENRILEEKVYTLSDTIMDFAYPEIPGGADGMQAMFYLVRDGKSYSESRHLVRQQPDRRLRLAWTSFRDRLQPGAEETWKLRVTLPDGRPAPAQLMAAMYDASLDAFRPHGWYFHQYFSLSLPNVNIGQNYWLGGHYISYSAPLRYASVRALQFDGFDPAMLAWGGYFAREEAFRGQPRVMNLVNNVYDVLPTTGRIAGATPMMTKSVAAAPESVMQSAVSGENEADMAGGSGAGDASATAVAVRENLNETAFFYPRLVAGADGEVSIAFTLPESLTTWKFMALAHTKDMMSGLLTDEIVAQKEVMAQLALPRFVRVGDRSTLSAILFNLTGAALKGKATMEVFDPATEKTLWKETVAVEIGAESDTVVSFVYEPSGELSLPACRILLEADGHTDGEQRYLPVLEDKEWLTQTKPFVVSKSGKTEVRLDGLFQNNHPDAEHRRLTVEYTANPLWYAVQALPSVLEPQTDDALSHAAAYYASTLSSDLAVRYPQLKVAVEAWQREAGDELESPLALQEDVTGIVLEETPWVADAEWETRRMQALQELFDANRQSDLRRQFAESLGKLQCADGSFGWFEGMPGNAWMTKGVARQLLRSGAGAKPDDVLARYVDLKKMMAYLMGEAHEDILRDKEHQREHKTPAYGGTYWLDYLYLASLGNVEWFDAAARQDLGYMQGRLLETVRHRGEDGGAHFSMAETALAVTVLRYMGEDDAAALLVQSLREHLVGGAEGLHLEYPSNGFVTSDRKIAMHVQLMEALSVAGTADAEEQDGLCRWLLSQKRLQDWGTTTNSMEAVYALMRGQEEDLDLRSGDAVRLLSPKGEELAVLEAAESKLAGLGTVSATVEGRELSDGAGTVEVTKTADRPAAWGAAYAQFRLPLSEVESAAAGLRVRCEVKGTDLKVGDRVTLRYVITADRDYEYVRLKAGRAACLEPVETASGYGFSNGLGYYKEVKDASTNYFFERLPKGTYVLEAGCYVERAGCYALGAVKLNGVYAPEFSAYGAGAVLEVAE